jgi:hypothetical protein
VEGNFKPFIPKWDSLCKHVGHKKVNKNNGTNVKKRDWYYSKVYRHTKNQKLFVSTTMKVLLPMLQMGWQEKK